jgi:TDG/mug DNA glycosylase family protein
VAATRSGSLDADIADDAIPNNFRALFHAHPDIRLIGFHGGTAAKRYRRHVVPTLTEAQRAIARTTLASTSPAHAGLSFAEKAASWAAVVFDDPDAKWNARVPHRAKIHEPKDIDEALL